jgi:hypothetical protein
MPSMPPLMSPDKRTTASPRCAALPFFLDTPSGPMFCLHRTPANAELRGSVLFIPAFNEEMNRCRSMLTLQAESLAAQGIGSLVAPATVPANMSTHVGRAGWPTSAWPATG